MRYHLGYGDGPKAQTLINLSSDYLIYSIGKKGMEFIGRTEEHAVKMRSRKIPSPNIAHALMIAQFRVVLTLALQKHGGKITRWSQGYDLRDMLRVRGQTPALVPDAFFTIEQDDASRHLPE